MSGSGNDFVVIDNRRGVIAGNLPSWARKLCDRHEGVGADGLLLLEKSKTADFRMLYFNADGSRATMCGNGARCISWVARELGVVGGVFRFQTDAGLVGAVVDGSMIEVTLSDPRDYRPDRKIKAGGKIYRVSTINTGVPHAIVWVPDAEKVNLALVGPTLRFHPAFGKAGTNVNFVQRVNGRTLRVRTYERGVEGETLACGTGVTASALCAALERRATAPVLCETTGGDRLEVRFDLNPANPAKPATRVSLRGPVRTAFRGEFTLNGKRSHV